MGPTIEQKFESTLALGRSLFNKYGEFIGGSLTNPGTGIHKMSDKIKNLSDPKEIIKKTGLGLAAAAAVGLIAISVNFVPRDVYAGGWPDTATPTFTRSPRPAFSPGSTPTITPTFTKTPDFWGTRIAEARETLVAVLDQKRKEEELRDLTRRIAEAQAGPTHTPTPVLDFRGTVTALIDQLRTESELAQLRRQIQALQETPVSGQPQNLTVNQIVAILERELKAKDAPARDLTEAQREGTRVANALTDELADRAETHTAVARLSATSVPLLTPTPTSISVPKAPVQERDWGTIILVGAVALIAGGTIVAFGDRRHWW